MFAENNIVLRQFVTTKLFISQKKKILNLRKQKKRSLNFTTRYIDIKKAGNMESDNNKPLNQIQYRKPNII